MITNVAYAFLLFGFTRDIPISHYTIAFVLMEMLIIVIIFTQQIWQSTLAEQGHLRQAHGTVWSTNKLLLMVHRMHNFQ